MSSKTFQVPAINCGHCVHTVQHEVGSLPGVRKVVADLQTKRVVVEWDTPATWDQIKSKLVEIEYPPVEANA
jgi:copper ion binding protein